MTTCNPFNPNNLWTKKERNMKRIIIISALTVVVATMVLSSCIRRDKNAKQRVLYTITRSQDLVDMADMTITYKDGKGNNVTEKITGTLWQKAITIGMKNKILFSI